jgi:hypothetical protein
MALVTTHCPVSHADVVRVTDLEGATLRVICADFDAATAACGLKVRAREGGPLSRLIERAAEGTLGSEGTRCHVA